MGIVSVVQHVQDVDIHHIHMVMVVTNSMQLQLLSIKLEVLMNLVVAVGIQLTFLVTGVELQVVKVEKNGNVGSTVTVIGITELVIQIVVAVNG